MKLAKKILLAIIGLTTVVQASNGYIPPNFEEPKRSPRIISPVPLTLAPPQPIEVIGNWVNCQPIRIDESIWDHERLTNLDLPEIWFTSPEVCSYDIIGPDGASEYFKLAQISGSSGFKSAQIQLVKLLDRETQEIHEIKVAAYNCGGQQVHSEIIQIVVGDINDHAPWFDPGSLKMTICPDMEPNTLIGTLIASDEDRGVYAKLNYLFTHRKPYGNQLMVLLKNGKHETWDNIFSLNAETGEFKLVTKDPRLKSTIKSITAEVLVRDHPGNQAFSSRSAQVIITLCNQPPTVVECNLGVLMENAPAGTITTGSNVVIEDSDDVKVNSIVAFEVLTEVGDGLLAIESVLGENGITTGIVKVVRPFNYETIEGMGVGGKKTVSMSVNVSNPKADNPGFAVAECTLIVKDVDDPPIWVPVKELRFRDVKHLLAVQEECPEAVDQCVDSDLVFAQDEDDDSLNIEYTANDEFFNVYSNQETNRAKICLKKVIDRETDCLVRLDNAPADTAFYPLTVSATDRGYSITTIVHIECIDVNDNFPVVELSPRPYDNVICQDLGRNFQDYAFLNTLGHSDINLTDSENGFEIVAIAKVTDIDHHLLGNTYPFTFEFTGENAGEFSMLPTSDSYIYLVAYKGSRTSLDNGEEIKFTIADAGVIDESTTHCEQQFIQPQVQLHNGAPFEHILHTCECNENEDDEYYPREFTCGFNTGAIWWIPLLGLLALMLLFCCCFACWTYCGCCAVAPIPAPKPPGPVIIPPTGEKPDWYYYLFNLLTVNKKLDVVDDTQHLTKSKMEADKVFHTYDEKRIYNLEGFSDDQPLINNRMSIVSGVSGLSKMTATTHQTQKKEIDWENILHGVQKIETIIVEDRADSVLSNGTDVTINDNKINILRSHHLIAQNQRQGGGGHVLDGGGYVHGGAIGHAQGLAHGGHAQGTYETHAKGFAQREHSQGISHGTHVQGTMRSHIQDANASFVNVQSNNSKIFSHNQSTRLHSTGDTNMNQDASFYSEGLVRSPSRISSQDQQRPTYGTGQSIDNNQRAMSPTAGLRFTKNNIIEQEDYEYDSDLDRSEVIDTNNHNISSSSDHLKPTLV